MKRFTIAYFGFLFAATMGAQEVSRFTFDVGGGFTQPVGNTGRHLDEGWNVRGGAGFNFSQYVGVMIQDGNVSVFSATLDPIVHLTPRSHFDVYLIGGGGLYRRTQEFTQPGLAAVTAFDPFFGFYTAAVPTTQVLSSYTVNKPGVNGGAGIAFGSKWHGKFFAEGRYHRIFMSNGLHTDYVPVSFGFRW
jgi:hypothetical protein